MKNSIKNTNTAHLREIAFFLEGFLAAKGNILPLGTIHLEELWNLAKEIDRANFEQQEEIKQILNVSNEK